MPFDDPNLIAPEGPIVASTEDDDAVVTKRAAVKEWQRRVRDAKAHWDDAFQRMRDCMDFVAGIQWDGQKKIDDSEQRYMCDWTLRAVLQKVASLYARNPEAEAKPRERLNYVLWDGDMQSLALANANAQAGRMLGMPDMAAEALLQDFANGQRIKQLVDRVCQTLRVVYQYNVDQAKPEFKEQMKQLVQRAVTCGVGYVRPNFVRDGVPTLSGTEARHTLADRMKQAREIMSRVQDEEIQETDPEVEQLRSLFTSIGATASGATVEELDERLEFDFPLATSIIVDTRCRSLKDFVAARWIAQEFLIPLDEANAFFELTGDDAITLGGELKVFGEDGAVVELQDVEGNKKDEQKNPLVCIWEVFDYQAKTSFFICDGHKDYLTEPTPPQPSVSGFWPVFALTFNQVESDPDTEACIFPPSDVWLVRHPQKEWNRTRNALRDQRNANAPKYVCRAGVLTDEDVENIKNAEPNSVIQLKGVPAGMKIDEVIGVLQTAKIDPAVYTVDPLREDMQMSIGMQDANLGPALPNVTATVGTIAEQSRLTITSSNVDDLDGLLSRLAKASGEMLLQAMSEQTVRRIAGDGAVWPVEQRAEFVQMIYLTIKAASSGRPNKALEVSNFQQLAPFLLNAGANPVPVIKEAVKRLDDRMDPSQFFPVPPPPGQAEGQQTGHDQNVSAGQKPQRPNGMIQRPPGQPVGPNPQAAVAK